MATRRAYDPGTGMEYDEYYEDTWSNPVEDKAPSEPPANYNPGSPGSATERINSQNPTANPDMKYVQGGDTGGYIAGIGPTIGEGRSLTPGRYQELYQAGADQYGQGTLDEWLKRNPTDVQRFGEAMESDDFGELGPDRSGKGQQGPNSGGMPDALRSQLQGLWGGGMNEAIVGSRLSNARDTLERQRKSRLATNNAMLANRGLMGAPGAPSGPEATMNNRLSESIADMFANATTDIYADESQNADDRMMDALRLSAGLDTADRDREAQQLIAQMGQELGWFNANTTRDLGLGNLALGNMNSVNNYNLGLADFGLRRDLGMAGLENDDIEQLMQMIRELMAGAQTSAGGYKGNG